MELEFENIKNETSEILERLKSDEINKEEMDALNQRLDELEERAAELKEEAKKADAEKREVIEGAGVEIAKTEEKREMEKFTIESKEYRSAWLHALQGKQLDEVEARAYASTDDNTAIPVSVSDKFFAKMKKVAPMLDEITLLSVAGSLKFAGQGTVNAATIHTENAAENAAADTIVSVTLGSKEFIKIIQISQNASTMSIDAFEDWLVEMLGVDIARAIDNYIINDSTNGLVKAATWTTGTNQVLNAATTGYTYDNIVDLVALLPAGYDANAKFLVNKKTLYGSIAKIVDSSKRPIFVNNAEEGMHGRILGFPVLVDDYVSTSDNAVYFGDYKQIVGNIQPGGVEVARDESAGFTSASIYYRGLGHFDSKPAIGEAFTRLVSTV